MQNIGGIDFNIVICFTYMIHISNPTVFDFSSKMKDYALNIKMVISQNLLDIQEVRHKNKFLFSLSLLI